MFPIRFLATIAFALALTPIEAQLERNIRIGEVMLSNTKSLIDEYGNHNPWVKIVNTSYTTYDIKGMYITTDTSVLSKEMPVRDRIDRMSAIIGVQKNTILSAKQHVIFFLNSNPKKGFAHLSAPITPQDRVWIALYSANAMDIIDSVTVPILEENVSYVQQTDTGYGWKMQQLDDDLSVISNQTELKQNKIAMLKHYDPHGFGITVLSMGIVFVCLFLLFFIFYVFGIILKHRQKMKNLSTIQPIKTSVKVVEKMVDVGHKTGVMMQDGINSKGIDKELYVAVISLALKQYLNYIHDVESGVITIKPKDTDWNVEYIQMTQFHE